MKLLIALRAEMLKTKRTASVYFTIIAAAFTPAIFLLNVLTGGGDVGAIAKDPLNGIFEMGAERSGVLIFPVFVILVCTLLPQIEYRNNTWKQVFAAPQTKGNVFLAKFLNINRLVLLFLFAGLVFMAFAVVITHFVHPSLNLLHQPLNVRRLAVLIANAYVTMLALCALQFWLGLRFRNFVIPTAVGFVLWITGMMMVLEFRSGMSAYYPYSFQNFPYMAQFQPKVAQVAWTSVGYATLFLLLGFLDFRKRRLTSV
jgi:lantibiotic transport system permease protein